VHSLSRRRNHSGELPGVDAPKHKTASSRVIPPTSLPTSSPEMIPQTHNLRDFLASLEKAVIQRALKITDGAQAEVARRLGMSRSDLSYKLGKHRIKDAAG